jgi:hypothetical protein
MIDYYKALREENYTIGIPSRERSFLINKRAGVYKYLYNRDYTYNYFIREEEREAYISALQSFKNIIAVPDDFNIAEKRNDILEYAIKKYIKYLFIIDDDIRISFRDETLTSKYSCRFEEFQARDIFSKLLYESIKFCDESYPIVGIPLRQGSFKLKYMFSINTPIIRFVCYHVPTLVKENLKITGLDTIFMSDRYIQLALLSKGYKSISNGCYSVDDPGTGYKGGCSIVRTVEKQTEAAIKLKKLYPDHIKLKEKSNSAIWKESRIDCKINWKGFLQEVERTYIPFGEGLEKIYGEDYEQYVE